MTEKNEDVLVPGSLDDLSGLTPDELRNTLEVLDAHLRSLHQTDEGELRDLSDDEDAALETGLEIRKAIVEKLDKHARISEIFRTKPQAVKQALSNIRYGLDDPAGDVRRLTDAEARDRAMRSLEGRDASGLSTAAKEQVERQLATNTNIARRILVTENEDYRTAWMKVMTQPHPLLTPEEQRALQAFQEYRAMAEGATTTGGYGVPVFIDPSIILTAQESGNPFLTLCRQTTVSTNQWKGVSSAGVTWSFDDEAEEVSDDSPTLGQPTVDVHMARGFIPFSIEVSMDYPAFAAEMSRLLAAGYDELLVDKFSRGSGSGEPRGILTALDANTNVEVVSTSDGQFVQDDVYKVWKSLPQKYRMRAAWMMSVDVNNRIRQFGTANVFHAYTENLPAAWADTLFGKSVYESPYFPDFTGTTGAENRLVVGDWDNYLIARNGGMNVELVQHLVSTSNNRPTGQRGWFAYSRIGGNSVNDLGFRLLQNQAS